MINLVSKITFIFLTQIYYNMNFVTWPSISSQDSLGALGSIFVHCFWRSFFVAHTKMHISENACKTCLKELGILLECRKTFVKFLAACNSSTNTGLPQFFFTGFWKLYFTNISFLTKNQKVPIMLTFINSKLTKLTKMTGKDKSR